MSDRAFRSWLLGVWIASVFASAVLAVPQGTAFSYQGRLEQGGGGVTGLHDFEFRLFDALSGGIQIGSTAVRNNVTVDRGLFTVELDFGGAVFLGDARWLDVSVRPSGGGAFTPLSPRQKLTPAPSALFSAMAPWNGLLNVPGGFADGVDNDTLGALSCAAGQIPRFNGSWGCATVSTAAGSGLTVSNLVLGTDPAVLQRRVTGECPAGQAIRRIAQDGTVECAQDPAPPVVADTGWLPAPMGNSVAVDLGTTDYDFVFGMTQSWDGVGGRITAPIMGAVFPDYMPAYVALSGSTAQVVGYAYTLALNNLGDLNSFSQTGQIRLRAIQRDPDFDSGWTACTGSTTTIFQHQLGVVPTLAIVEVAQNGDGSGWRVPTMSASNHDGSLWRQTALVELTSSAATLRTHGSLAHFRNDAAGTNVPPASGFCRLRLFNWTPDYTSAWTSISTSEGNRDKWFRHGLGQIPSLIMVWIAQNSDGSGWRLPAMSATLLDGSFGTSLYDLTEEWAVIKGGQSAVARFVNPAGNGQAPTSGFVQVMAWR